VRTVVDRQRGGEEGSVVVGEGEAVPGLHLGELGGCQPGGEPAAVQRGQPGRGIPQLGHLVAPSAIFIDPCSLSTTTYATF
jgi:hypothetical protein